MKKAIGDLVHNKVKKLNLAHNKISDELNLCMNKISDAVKQQIKTDKRLSLIHI